MSEIGNFLKQLRKSRKLSISKVCIATGIADSTLCRIEQGKNISPAAKDLKALSDFYNVDAITLYTKSGYLSKKDLDSYKAVFKNTEKLSSNELDLVQKIINALADIKNNGV